MFKNYYKIFIKSVYRDTLKKYQWKYIFVFHSTLEKLNVQSLEVKQIALKSKFTGKDIVIINMITALLRPHIFSF